MRFKLDRIISIATLMASLAAIVLVLRRPSPVAPAPAPAMGMERPQAGTESPVERPPLVNGVSASSASPGSAAPRSQTPVNTAPAAPSDARVNSDAVSGALAKMLSGGAARRTSDAEVGGSQPVIKDQQVTMDGDVVHGKFLTEIEGKDTWVTISGRLGEKDGYATFDPTEIKVGDMDIPVSLVNPVLQKKMAEERDRLKIPDHAEQ